MQEKKVNAGYTIIERQTVDELGYVIGENKNAPAPYVTWCYRADTPNYFFWGNYKQTKEAAQKDFQRRIQKDLDLIKEMGGSRIKKHDESELGR